MSIGVQLQASAAMCSKVPCIRKSLPSHSNFQDVSESNSDHRQIQRVNTASANTDGETGVEPIAAVGDVGIPGTSAAMHMAAQRTIECPEVPQPPPADVPSVSALPNAVARPVADAAGYRMPPPPRQSQVADIAFQYTIRTDDAAVEFKQSRLKKYRQQFEMLRNAGVSS